MHNINLINVASIDEASQSPSRWHVVECGVSLQCERRINKAEACRMQLAEDLPTY